MQSNTDSHFKIIPWQQIEPIRWNKFVDSCDEAWLLHRFDLLQAVSTWEAKKNNSSFAIIEKTNPIEILAIVPAFIIKSKIFRFLDWNAIDSPGGPAVKNGLGESLKRKLLDFAIAYLKSLGATSNSTEIRFSIEGLAPANRGNNLPKVNPLLELGCENTLGQTWMLDLQKEKSVIWNNMEKRARNAIRKAEKSGVTIRQVNNLSDLDIYYKLHCQTYLRTGVKPHPRDYFEAIWHDFLPVNRAIVFFGEYNHTVIAAENFGIYKSGAVYWSGAASTEGLDFQANSLIQWTAIQWMLDHGVEWYDTGEAFPQLGGGKRKGLNDFKKSFGGQLFPLYRGKLLLKKQIIYLYQAMKSFK